MVDEKDPRIITPIPKHLLARIDDYRFENRLPSRSEAIRQLIETGLSAKKPPAPAGGDSPGGASKPRTTAKTAAPAERKPGRQTEPAQRQSKEAQIRALREQGAGQ
jgi:hypothetical protein